MPTPAAIPPAILAQNPLCNSLCRVCHYKDLTYSAQLQRKQRWAESQLTQWSACLQAIRPAPEEEQVAYRSKSWMRSRFQDGDVSFGMFRGVQIQGRWGKEFVSWNTCPIHVKPIQEMVQNIRSVLSRQVPEFLENSLVGVWIGSPHLVIVSRNLDLEVMKQLDWSNILVPPFDRVWFHCNPQVGRNVFGHRPIEAIVGSSSEDSVHPVRAFRQVAQTLLIEARAQALKAILQSQPTLVLDLYCGTGDLSLLLPPNVGWIGIEISQEAAKYANTLRKPGIAEHAAFTGAVEHRLNDPKVWNQVRSPYVLYLNPPRSGLTEVACERLVTRIREKAPQAIIYLSCSASSLARDLRALELEGYVVKFLQPYDFFPQTEHFETLAILSKG